ncbi:MAG: rubrerythrin family protein [bacterium]
MKDRTTKCLEEAFAGESMAHLKYLLFSDIADREGLANIARLFKAIAYAEQVHAGNHAVNLEITGETTENLQSCIDGENYEVEEMYPAFDAVAKLQQEKGAEQSIHYALEAEKIHSEMFKQAKQAVDLGQDQEIDEIYICPVCGFTHIGKPPDCCPVCGISSKKFKNF